MKRYVLLPEDTIEVLPQQGEAEPAVSVFCERTLILFPCSKIEALCMQKHVTENRLKAEDCLQFTARDALFDTQQAVLVPVTRPDYAAFCEALRAVRPALFAEMPEQEFTRETCDQTGSHLHSHK